MTTQKTEEGIKERLALLSEASDADVEGFYQTACLTFRKPTYAPTVSNQDDIIDALVAAISAASTERELPSLPRETEPDYDEVLERKIEIKVPVIA